MLHWYRLIRATREETSRPTAPPQLIDSGPLPPKGTSLADIPEQRLTASLTPEEREKLFWLGLIEATPLFAGGVFSVYTDSKLHAVIAALVAIILTALVCWLLRDQVPLTRIELSTQRPNQALEPTAGRRDVHI